jgi:predicted AlkP superfamily pyrophosphatase or phosphodiesterase
MVPFYRRAQGQQRDQEELMRKLQAFLIALLLAGCAAQSPTSTWTSPTTAAATKPRLVVFMVVDGLPQRQVVDYRDQLAPDGLRRFLDRGAWFSDAHYGHAFTVTAAGHATMLTGAYPHRTGIIGNDWRNPVTGEVEYCTGDTRYTYIGNKTNRLDGTSPENLKVETVGDVLKRANPASKVIAISGKDRGAILPGGKTGTAYMYMAQTGEFASSTFYMPEHPGWVKAFNAAKPADKYFQVEWKALLADSAYVKSLPDNQKWYPKGGSLPKLMGEGMDKPGALFYGAVMRSPFGDALTLDFARAAIRGENLGADDAPDILSVSLSTHDYINHGYGAESRLSHDHVLQLDRLFQAFFADLDATVGKDNYVAVLTADHGFMPAPEYSQMQGHDSGRLSASQSIARMNKTLSARFGEGEWVKYISARSLVLNRQLAGERGVVVDTLANEARKAILAEPGIEAAYTRSELESGSAGGKPLFDQMARGWNREISGDVEFALKRYWMVGSSSNMTTHGSPHSYDTNVPLLFYGPAWVKPGRIDTRVEEVDIAPTLARMLGVAAPAAVEGKALPLN